MSESLNKLSTQSFAIQRVTKNGRDSVDDSLAVEEPLEIRVVFGPEENRRSKSLSITMRTPGKDFELAAGFMLSENIVSRPEDVVSFEHVGPSEEGREHGNTLMVELGFGVDFAIERLQRHFYTTSSCGICGKASLDSIRAQGAKPIESGKFSVKDEVIFGLPNSIRKQQSVFEQTGGLHAAALATAGGKIVAISEDVGRHNAVDKLIGSQMLANSFPLDSKILVVSGRASFELVQKAIMARIPVMVAVGAPSSLAVELAREFGVRLIGFCSESRFNDYSACSTE